MADSDGADLPEATPSEDRAARQLAAMRFLFDAKRERQRIDIILATVFEALSPDRSRTTNELLRQIELDWPGVVLSRERLESALEVAESQGLISATDQLTSTTAWVATARTQGEVEESKQWAEDVIHRCRGQVRDRARENDLQISDEQANLWTELLLEVLHEGIVQSFAAEPSAVRQSQQRLFPPYDRGRIIESARSKIDDPVEAEFLSAMALAALDPGSVFGTEVVHYLATGYILYGTVVGMDGVGEVAELENFQGEVLLLDTPVLLRLLSTGTEFQWLSDLVGRIASAAGARTAVTSRTREELENSLVRRDGQASRYEGEMRDGVDREKLAAIVQDDVMAIWLREPSRPSWDQFKRSVDRLFDTLKAIRVDCDFQDDGYVSEPGKRRQFAETVREVTAERGKERHAVPSDHDGELLCVVSHCRERKAESRASDGVWPGAFIVTTDRSLDEVWKRAGGQGGRVSLTISQTAALLSHLAQPSDAKKLAELIAADMQWHARLQHGSSIGVDEAIELARSFTERDRDALIVEAARAELSFEDLVTAADYDGDSTNAARRAVAQRMERRRQSAAAHKDAQEGERKREEVRRIRAEEELKAFKKISREESLQSSEALRTKDAHITKLNRTLVIGGVYGAAIVLLLVARSLAWIRWHDFVLPLLGMIAPLQWIRAWIRDPQESIWLIAFSVSGWLTLGVLSRVIVP